jgi:hypothetical protein
LPSETTVIDPLSEELISKCRRVGVDPTEIRVAASRYVAYREFYARSGRGQALPVDQWFRWYYAEASSETDGSSPSGCSVDSDSRNRGLMTDPANFLELLREASAT